MRGDNSRPMYADECVAARQGVLPAVSPFEAFFGKDQNIWLEKLALDLQWFKNYVSRTFFISLILPSGGYLHLLKETILFWSQLQTLLQETRMDQAWFSLRVHFARCWSDY